WGKTTSNVEPFPGSLSTMIVPSCHSTLFLTMDSPSPVLFSVRVRALSTLYNRSKICSVSSAAMPIPVSVTDTATPPSLSRRERTVTDPPASVYRIAFVTRFIQTDCNRFVYTQEENVSVFISTVNRFSHHYHVVVEITSSI